MKYQYTGMTRSREKVEGVIEAKSEQEARLRLFSMQVRPLAIQEEPKTSDFIKKLNNIQLAPVIDLKGLMIFTRQLSSLVNSGVPVVTALDILAKQERRKTFKRILTEIKEHIEAGGGFAESLQKYPGVFSEFYIRVVEAGEISGTLDRALIRVNQQLEKLARLKKKVIGALTYPAITLVVAIGVVFFLLWKVVPEVTRLYGNSKLPALTMILLDVSGWVQNNYLFLFLGLICTVVGSSVLYGMPNVREVVDPVLLKSPVLGTLLLRAGVASFSRTLSTLVSSGVPLLQGFDICEKVVSNRCLRKSVTDARNAVIEGRGISQGLGERNLFPPMVIHMISTGEMTGRLDEMLLKIADIYDEEVDDAVGMVTALLNPAMIVAVGIIVMFILVAMYLPIFSLSEKLAG